MDEPEIEIVKQLAKIIDPKTIDKLYDEGLSSPVKEVGKIATDVLKTARLFAAPFQIAAAYQDRFTRFVNRVIGKVPEDRRTVAASHIAGPIFERLKYLEEDNDLTELYLNLLARAIDKERSGEAHPSFVTIIDLISPDEAMVLYTLKDSVVPANLNQATRTLDSHGFPIEKLAYPEKFDLYLSHLTSLNLLKDFSETIAKAQQSYLSNLANVDVGSGLAWAGLPSGRRTLPAFVSPRLTIDLTEFGREFVNACVPEDYQAKSASK